MITIKDNIIKLDFHEETLHCDIYADGTKWTWQHNYQPYYKYNGKDVVVPIYVEVENGERLERAIKRERLEKEPK